VKIVDYLKNNLYRSKHKLIHIRGGLGNQVIQACVGTAIMSESKIEDFNYVYNCGEIKALVENNHIPERHYLYDIFKLKRNVRSEHLGKNKTKYWEHGSAFLLKKHFQFVEANLPLNVSNSKAHEAVVHIRATCKNTTSDFHIYSCLIDTALSKHNKVVIIGDNPSLLTKLQNHFLRNGTLVDNETSSSPLEDWFKLLSARNLYCSPSSFAYSTKLFNNTGNIYIINPKDYTTYVHAVNEYIFLSELKKYFSGVNFLDSFKHSTFQESKKSSHAFVSPALLTLGIKEYTNLERSSDFCFDSYISEIKNNTHDSLISTLLNNNNMVRINSLEKIKEFLITLIKNQRINQIYNKTFNPYELISRSLSSDLISHKDFYPPILEESGLSITRQILFSLNYIFSQYDHYRKSQSLSSEQIKNFIHQGYLVINDFFKNDINILIKDINDFIEDNQLKILDNSSRSNQFPSEIINRIFKKDHLVLISDLTGYSLDTVKDEITRNFSILNTNYSFKDSASFYSNEFGISSFYPQFKLFYFPDNISTDYIKMQYVPLSHLPSNDLLTYHNSSYKINSYQNRKAAMNKSNELLSAGIEQIYKLGLEPININVAGNSLVIINLSGFNKVQTIMSERKCYSIESVIKPKNIFDKKNYLKY